MKFTFGIITSQSINTKILNSIYEQSIPEFEIIIVGGDPLIGYPNLTHIPFNDNEFKYTRKKNIITREAKYNNILYMHDYFYLMDDWYSGFLKFGDDWDICMNKIYNSDNSRFRDWCALDDPEINYPYGGIKKGWGSNHRIMLPPYNYDKKHYMYISGGFWIAKKYIMEKEPLNESLDWGESEDIEWSKRVLPKYNYKINTYSSVKSLKYKKLSAEYLEY